MSSLTDLSQALAGIVESASAQVVRVEGRPRFGASGIVWNADGAIVTAHHVLEDEENIRIGLANGDTVPAKLAGRDPGTDVAVLRAETKALPVPVWAESSSLGVGHLVLALGRPGHKISATLGVVSALGDSWRTMTGGRVDRYLQTDITMYPGFSGGPLVGADGRFIGMNTSGLLRDRSIALPSATLAQTVQTLLTKGKVSRGYLGIGAQPVRLPEVLAKQTGQETGLLLVSVEPGGPADRAGLLLGDVLTSIEGQPTRHLDDLLATLASDRVGTTVTVRSIRGGQMRDVSVVVGERE